MGRLTLPKDKALQIATIATSAACRKEAPPGRGICSLHCNNVSGMLRFERPPVALVSNKSRRVHHIRKGLIIDCTAPSIQVHGQVSVPLYCVVSQRQGRIALQYVTTDCNGTRSF